MVQPSREAHSFLTAWSMARGSPQPPSHWPAGQGKPTPPPRLELSQGKPTELRAGVLALSHLSSPFKGWASGCLTSLGYSAQDSGLCPLSPSLGVGEGGQVWESP